MRKLLFFLFLLYSLILVAQPSYDFVNKTYLDHLTTVRLHVAGFPSSYPIIDLNGGARLQLSFDDHSQEVRRYTYRIVHCNQDWKPSSLSPLEYLDGYLEDNLDEYNFSFRTLAEYIHYDLYFPNRDLRFTKSGNYLLVITDDEDDEIPAITRRFMVVESLTNVGGAVNRAAEVRKVHTHQEVDFTVNTEQLRLRNPIQELSATVLQNGRWDNAVYGIKPTLMRRESVIFDHQGKVSFSGGNEFRNLDIRSIQAPRGDVLEITNEGNRYAMVLAPDRPRDQQIFLNYFDLNGDFVNFRDDRPIINVADDYFYQNYERLNLEFTGDYVDLTFVLKTGTPYEDSDVWLFGGFTEFKKKDRFKMVWNPALNAYVVRVSLKQGFYNYWYVTEPNGFNPTESRENLSVARTEGNFDEAENDYVVLVYWRPIGGRYDQLVGSTVLNSNVD